MKLSKIFHFLYFAVLSIPLVTIPIFAIYSQNHEINDNTLQVQENKVVDFNQLKVNGNFENNDTYSIWQNNGTMTISNNTAHITNASAGSSLVTSFNVIANHWYLISNNFSAQSGIYFSFNGAQQSITSTGTTQLLQMKTTWTTDRTIYFVVVVPTNTFNIDYDISNLQVFDLTQMYGEGNEPTIEQFNTYFPNSYYPYTESEEIVIENYETITYDDTDIMSQFLYSEYNFMDKYLGMYKYQPFSGIYSWLSNTFFGGSAPLVFTIFYQWFSYWLFVSLCWMVFDVLIYIPMVAHRWLDKGALE